MTLHWTAEDELALRAQRAYLHELMTGRWGVVRRLSVKLLDRWEARARSEGLPMHHPGSLALGRRWLSDELERTRA